MASVVDEGTSNGALVEWFWEEKRSTGIKSRHSATWCAASLSMGLDCDQTRACEVRSRPLTAWAVAQPWMLCVVIWRHVVRLIGSSIVEETADCIFMKLTVCWVVMPLFRVDRHRRCGGTRCLHPLPWRWMQHVGSCVLGPHSLWMRGFGLTQTRVSGLLFLGAGGC